MSKSCYIPPEIRRTLAGKVKGGITFGSQGYVLDGLYLGQITRYTEIHDGTVRNVQSWNDDYSFYQSQANGYMSLPIEWVRAYLGD